MIVQARIVLFVFFFLSKSSRKSTNVLLILLSILSKTDLKSVRAISYLVLFFINIDAFPNKKVRDNETMHFFEIHWHSCKKREKNRKEKKKLALIGTHRFVGVRTRVLVFYAMVMYGGTMIDLLRRTVIESLVIFPAAVDRDRWFCTGRFLRARSLSTLSSSFSR